MTVGRLIELLKAQHPDEKVQIQSFLDLHKTPRARLYVGPWTDHDKVQQHDEVTYTEQLYEIFVPEPKSTYVAQS